MINIIEQTFFPDGGSSLRDNKNNVYTFDEIYQLYLEDLAYRELRVRQVNDEFKEIGTGEDGSISLNDIRYMQQHTDSEARKRLESKLSRLDECMNRRKSWYKASTYCSEDNIDCYINENDTLRKRSKSKKFICKQPEHRNIGYITYVNKSYLIIDKSTSSIGKGNLRTDVYRHKKHESNNKYLIIIEDGKAGFTFYSWFIIEYLNRKVGDTGDIEIHLRSADGYGGVKKIMNELNTLSAYKGILLIADKALDFVNKGHIRVWINNLSNIQSDRMALFAPLSLELVASTFIPMITCSTGIGDFEPAFFSEIIDMVNTGRPVAGFNSGKNKYQILNDKYVGVFKQFDRKGVKNYGKTVESELARYLDGYTRKACYSYKKGHMGFPWMNNCCKLGQDVCGAHSKECASLRFKDENKIDMWMSLKCVKRLILSINYVIMGMSFSTETNANITEWKA